MVALTPEIACLYTFISYSFPLISFSFTGYSSNFTGYSSIFTGYSSIFTGYSSNFTSYSSNFPCVVSKASHAHRRKLPQDKKAIISVSVEEWLGVCACCVHEFVQYIFRQSSTNTKILPEKSTTPRATLTYSKKSFTMNFSNSSKKLIVVRYFHRYL